MKNKEFKRLNRTELVEIIYQLQQDNQALIDENTELKEKLNSKELKVSNAGSIAEAVIGLSDIFQIAQNAADEYLVQIHRSSADVEANLSEKVAMATREAEAIRADAIRKSNEMFARATFESEKRIREAQEKIEQMLRSHQALKEFLADGRKFL